MPRPYRTSDNREPKAELGGSVHEGVGPGLTRHECRRALARAPAPEGSGARVLHPSAVSGPGLMTFAFSSLAQLHYALDRVYKLAVSLPDAPLARFNVKTAGLPRTTEAERLVVMRIGQDIFRDALMDYWDGRCPLTGITEPALLRARISCPGPTATMRSASTCTTASCSRHSGTPPSTRPRQLRRRRHGARQQPR